MNPPTRFIYCRYSVFFSLRTAYTLFPGTLVFLVVRNRANPFICRSNATSGSESSSISVDAGADSAGAVAVVDVAAVGGSRRGAVREVEAPLGWGGGEDVLGGFLGPVGGAALVAFG